MEATSSQPLLALFDISASQDQEIRLRANETVTTLRRSCQSGGTVGVLF
jgi:hypothetical protein